MHTSMSLTIITCVFVFLSYVDCANIKVDPLVLTSRGPVRGKRAIGDDYSVFLGIPYAQVDLSNPFRDSLPYPYFEEAYNAYSGDTKCPQSDFKGNNIKGTLDCLRLNIYVPNKASSQNLLPVIFWIHGGGFSGGSGGSFDGKYLVKHDVILVTVNYRVGPYGFMCLNTSKVPGNQGLKDQHLALIWVKENISAFGGNVSSITIAGQSAGAGSIDLHLHSPYEKHFHRAIMESGSAKVEGMFVNPDLSAAVKLAEQLGFNTADNDLAVDFLITCDPHSVIAASKRIEFWFRPCKEKEFANVSRFVVEDSQNMQNKHKIKDTPIMIGYTTSEEYNHNVDEVLSDDIVLRELKTHFTINENELSRVSKILRHFYIGDSEITRELLLQLGEFESDFTFNYPMDRAIVRYLEQEAKVYQYLFSYTSDGSVATHGAEVKFLFPVDHEPLLNENDVIISDRMTTMWTNFAKYGSPTPEVTKEIPTIWEQCTKTDRPYMHIGANLTLGHRVYHKRMAFWDMFYDKYEETFGPRARCLALIYLQKRFESEEALGPRARCLALIYLQKRFESEETLGPRARCLALIYLQKRFKSEETLGPRARCLALIYLQKRFESEEALGPRARCLALIYLQKRFKSEETLGPRARCLALIYLQKRFESEEALGPRARCLALIYLQKRFESEEALGPRARCLALIYLQKRFKSEETLGPRARCLALIYLQKRFESEEALGPRARCLALIYLQKRFESEETLGPRAVSLTLGRLAFLIRPKIDCAASSQSPE
ncbi:Bile salt-activated lipase [Eumeta japonica]|uniref:Bile salt-activated lipase n=1 Tax=Eumeta variegata TaxID=151549 RepID=A0A4C1V353_EUMVA|nr:Bile salt-activated lipase [Eumeta japonica]